MKSEKIKERIVRFLELQPKGATSEEIAGGALKLGGARGAVADKIVEAAVDGDARVVMGRDGLWTLASASRTIRKATFVSMGVRAGVDGSGSERLSGIAGRRFGMEGLQERFPEAAVGEVGEEEKQAFLSFASFARSAVPVAFRLPRLSRLVNRCARWALGHPLLKEGVCLYRLGRRVFPDQPLVSLEALSDAAGLSYLTDRGPEEEAGLQANLLLMLLERYGAEGGVEEVISDLYPDALPVHFEAYAFDEAFLDELPQQPGVYIMRDQAGCVIYVGKSVNLRDRVRVYFSRRSERSEKARRILARIWSMEVQTVGSELEALLLEARLIRLCKPEFNIQMAVHERSAEMDPVRNFVLVLPSSEPDSLELFCIREAEPLEQARVRRDLSDWSGVSEQIERLYFGEFGSEFGVPSSKFQVADAGLSEGDAADLETLKRWLAQRQQQVDCVDMDGAGRSEEALRVLGDYVRGCDLEGWEKVWRI